MSQDTIVRKIRLSKAKSYVKKAFDKADAKAQQ